MGLGEFSPRPSALFKSSWVFTSDGVIPTSEPLPAVHESSAWESLLRRPNFAIGVAAASVIGILALIAMVSILSKLFGPGIYDERPVVPISPPAAVAPMNGSRTGAAVQSGRGIETTPSPGAPTQANSPAPIPPTHQAVPVSKDRGWVARLKSLLSNDEPAKMDPALNKVPVWTVQRSGYYYCADSPDFKKLRPGALKTQIEALQTGYGPILGSYCQ
jgi:hypothetical protein